MGKFITIDKDVLKAICKTCKYWQGIKEKDKAPEMICNRDCKPELVMFCEEHVEKE